MAVPQEEKKEEHNRHRVVSKSWQSMHGTVSLLQGTQIISIWKEPEFTAYIYGPSNTEMRKILGALASPHESGNYVGTDWTL